MSERDQFEAWAKSIGYKDEFYFFTNSHPNHYDDDRTEDMWAAWQASREALKAEQGEDSELLASAKIIEKAAMDIVHSLRQPTSEGWIACAERMPEVEDKYITFSSYGVGASWFMPSWSNKFQDCASNNDEGMEDDEGRIFRVTHWQPLPSPPAINHPIDTTTNQYDALGKGGKQ